jgi:hypothetical protein
MIMGMAIKKLYHRMTTAPETHKELWLRFMPPWILVGILLVEFLKWL